MNAIPLLDVQSVCQAFRKADGDELVVLEGVNLMLREGEIVGLLGRSGSGKSMLISLTMRPGCEAKISSRSHISTASSML